VERRTPARKAETGGALEGGGGETRGTYVGRRRRRSGRVCRPGGGVSCALGGGHASSAGGGHTAHAADGGGRTYDHVCGFRSVGGLGGRAERVLAGGLEGCDVVWRGGGEAAV
jgi:hypothetical protein